MRPVVLVLLIMAFLSLCYSIWHAYRGRQKKKEAKEKGNLFGLALLVIFAGGLYLCMEWSVKARLFPMLLGVAGTVLSLWMVIPEMRRVLSPGEKEEELEGGDLESSDEPAKQKATPKSEIIMILWVLGFLGIVLVFGFWVAIVGFTALFMSLYGREKWTYTIIFTVGIWSAMYFVFAISMKVPLYGGILGLSW